MDRTLTVQGTARLSLRPDWVEISVTLTNEDAAYDAAMEKAEQQLTALRDALSAAGFDRDELKTAGFHVTAQYDFRNDGNGNSTRVFRGYDCTHQLHLALAFDPDRLGQALSALTDCPAQPELNVRFTVQDPDKASDELLRQAAANARQRAEVLAAASGVKLGTLVRIDYGWDRPDFFSPTSLAVGAAPRMAKFAMADMTPEDIDLSDRATFVWEIL